MHLYTTEGGYRRLLARIKKALADYDLVTASNEDAAGAGDTSVWHDNFDYEENQRQMHQLAKRVSELKDVRASLTVVPLPQDPKRIGIGTAVTIEEEESGQISRYQIAGFEDGDPQANRLSYTAPLAKALLGACIGDVRVMHLAGKDREYVVVKIETVQEEDDQ